MSQDYALLSLHLFDLSSNGATSCRLWLQWIVQTSNPNPGLILECIKNYLALNRPLMWAKVPYLTELRNTTMIARSKPQRMFASLFLSAWDSTLDSERGYRRARRAASREHRIGTNTYNAILSITWRYDSVRSTDALRMREPPEVQARHGV